MIDFFRKLFPRKPKHIVFNHEAIDELMESVNFYDRRIPPGFYMALLEIVTADGFDMEDIRHYKAFQQMKEQVENLASLFDQLVTTRLDDVRVKNFVSEFERYATGDYELPGVKVLLTVYWYRPIMKFKDEISNSGDSDLIAAMDDFHDRIRPIMDRVMGIN